VELLKSGRPSFYTLLPNQTESNFFFNLLTPFRQASGRRLSDLEPRGKLGGGQPVIIGPEYLSFSDPPDDHMILRPGASILAFRGVVLSYQVQ